MKKRKIKVLYIGDEHKMKLHVNHKYVQALKQENSIKLDLNSFGNYVLEQAINAGDAKVFENISANDVVIIEDNQHIDETTSEFLRVAHMIIRALELFELNPPQIILLSATDSIASRHRIKDMIEFDNLNSVESLVDLIILHRRKHSDKK